jgi:hypothetical protein
LCGVVDIRGFDPNILNNIEKSQFRNFINWRCEFESDYTSGFVGFPLLFGSRLLYDQDIADITLESRSAVSNCVDGVQCVEQAGVAVRHVSTRTVAKWVGRNSEA